MDDATFLPYDLEGPVQPEMSWLPISYERTAQQGCHLMRMSPGAVTIEHTHPGLEEFLILSGELIDGDGTVFRTGDFVRYAPGTRHNSRTATGCVLAVFEWRPPAAQDQVPSGTHPEHGASPRQRAFQVSGAA